VLELDDNGGEDYARQYTTPTRLKSSLKDGVHRGIMALDFKVDMLPLWIYYTPRLFPSTPQASQVLQAWRSVCIPGCSEAWYLLDVAAMDAEVWP
jgi:hypothetical protein